MQKQAPKRRCTRSDTISVARPSHKCPSGLSQADFENHFRPRRMNRFWRDISWSMCETDMRITVSHKLIP